MTFCTVKHHLLQGKTLCADLVSTIFTFPTPKALYYKVSFLP
ncbi:hypothetical protein HMPREF3218_0200863 [Prevotella bivia]|uniref:Uncharacterized protein n=1 Tax=Prevotella bivia TaxID=28125 RepID=A0A137SQA5_9BACT|nr:hypothetical protein HMPREF3202_02350 [Prevotella bivia]KXU58771.1 hypothetical protein HMPREF3218_0200863 [Prevotella bivia]